MSSGFFNPEESSLVASYALYALQGEFLLAGKQNPSVVPTPGRKGALWLQAPLNGGMPAIYHKQDNGLSTNWILVAGGGLGGANQALSNLLPTAINEHLVPNADNVKDLGASGLAWRELFVREIASGNLNPVTIASNLDFGTVQKIINLPLPTLNGDAASKQYVDSKLIDIEDEGASVRVGPTFINFKGDGVTASLNGTGVDVTIPGTTGNTSEVVEYAVVPPGGAVLGQITLTLGVPATPQYVTLTPKGGILQEYGVDFSVAGNVLSWNPGPLMGVISDGDVLIVTYPI